MEIPGSGLFVRLDGAQNPQPRSKVGTVSPVQVAAVVANSREEEPGIYRLFNSTD